MMLQPLPAAKALESYFLEARARLLDLAAILDRIGRGTEKGSVADDPRMQRIRQALEILHDADSDRAKRVQEVFSIEYDGDWRLPKPKS